MLDGSRLSYDFLTIFEIKPNAFQWNKNQNFNMKEMNMNTDFWCSWCSDRANFCVLDWSRQYASFELSHNLFEQTFFLGKKKHKPNPFVFFFISKKKFADQVVW